MVSLFFSHFNGQTKKELDWEGLRHCVIASVRQSISAAEVQACRKPTERDNEIIIKKFNRWRSGFIFWGRKWWSVLFHHSRATDRSSLIRLMKNKSSRTSVPQEDIVINQIHFGIGSNTMLPANQSYQQSTVTKDIWVTNITLMGKEEYPVSF